MPYHPMRRNVKKISRYGIVIVFCILMMFPMYFGVKRITNDFGNNPPTLGFVHPLFTNAAYGDGAFYDVISRHVNATPDNFRAKVPKVIDSLQGGSKSSDEFISVYQGFLDDGYPISHIKHMTDLDIQFNRISKYKVDTLVFFHNEYVTTQYIQNVLNYVNKGGKVIIIGGNSFYAEIGYEESTNEIYLIDGHSLWFNGQEIHKSMYHRFFSGIGSLEQLYMTGSVYCQGKYGPTKGIKLNENTDNSIVTKLLQMNYHVLASNYQSREENCLVTPNVQIFGTLIHQNNKFRGIHYFEYRPFMNQGSIVNFGIFGETSLAGSRSLRRALIETAIYQRKNTEYQPLENGIYRKNQLKNYNISQYIIDENKPEWTLIPTTNTLKIKDKHLVFAKFTEINATQIVNYTKFTSFTGNDLDYKLTDNNTVIIEAMDAAGNVLVDWYQPNNLPLRIYQPIQYRLENGSIQFLTYSDENYALYVSTNHMRDWSYIEQVGNGSIYTPRLHDVFQFKYMTNSTEYVFPPRGFILSNLMFHY